MQNLNFYNCAAEVHCLCNSFIQTDSSNCLKSDAVTIYSNSIFIAPNLYPKTDSRRTKQRQKTVIINLRHSKGQHHGEK